MSYSDPRPYAYSYYHDFGAATEALVLRGPSGKRGSIKEIEVEVKAKTKSKAKTAKAKASKSKVATKTKENGSRAPSL